MGRQFRVGRVLFSGHPQTSSLCLMSLLFLDWLNLLYIGTTWKICRSNLWIHISNHFPGNTDVSSLGSTHCKSLYWVGDLVFWMNVLACLLPKFYPGEKREHIQKAMEHARLFKCGKLCMYLLMVHQKQLCNTNICTVTWEMHLLTGRSWSQGKHGDFI